MRVLAEQRAGAGAFGAGLAQDGVLLGRELAAPVGVALVHFVTAIVGHGPHHSSESAACESGSAGSAARRFVGIGSVGV